VAIKYLLLFCNAGRGYHKIMGFPPGGSPTLRRGLDPKLHKLLHFMTNFDFYPLDTVWMVFEYLNVIS
jgi:hypothetical protein